MATSTPAKANSPASMRPSDLRSGNHGRLFCHSKTPAGRRSVTVETVQIGVGACHRKGNDPDHDHTDADSDPAERA